MKELQSECADTRVGVVWYYCGEYIRVMKRKTSVTLTDEAISALDRLAGRGGNRSAVVERAIRELLSREEKQARDARELEVLNRNAERLNREAEDVLSYQVEA
jgi:Arc/MetJ-type ribon-helix-helix transcriptional regulator